MKFTNNKEFPDAVYNMVVDISNEYTKGDANISTTQLIDEPLQRILKREYADKLVEDISDSPHRLHGSVLHKYLSQARDESNCIREKRLYVTINDWVLSGSPDYFIDGGTLIDYKYTTKYKTKSGFPDDWNRQMNIYKYILEKNGHSVDKLQVCVFYRDANARDAAMELLDCPIDDEIEAYIKARMAYHQMSDPEFNPLIDVKSVNRCSTKARWQTLTRWAIKKRGRKSAVQVFDTKEEAETFLPDVKNHSIEERKGESRRCCEKYCTVYNYCQYMKGDENGKADNPDE